MIFEAEKIDDLIAQRRLAEAAALLALVRSESEAVAAQVRQLRAAIFALAGDDRGLARIVEPELLACRSGAEVAAHYVAASTEPSSVDHLIAGVLLTWLADARGSCDSLGHAHDRALVERRFALAVGARERLAYHALIFGQVELARKAIDEAIALADMHRFSNWLLRAVAAAARLALDAGDLDGAAQLLARSQT
jgi:hypothetical protein